MMGSVDLAWMRLYHIGVSYFGFLSSFSISGMALYSILDL